MPNPPRITVLGWPDLPPPMPHANPTRGAMSAWSPILSCVSKRKPRLSVKLGRTRQSSVAKRPASYCFTVASGTGQSYSNEDHYELQNFTSIAHGKHFLKFGGRLRDVRLVDLSTGNYNGTYTFQSLEAYNANQPSQFSITQGVALATVKQYDAGLFATDDWRVRPNFTLSLGLRFETQDNIGDRADIDRKSVV